MLCVEVVLCIGEFGPSNGQLLTVSCLAAAKQLTLISCLAPEKMPTRRACGPCSLFLSLPP